MEAKKKLQEYLLNHPDYWDFDEEIKEVNKLRKEINKKQKADI